MGQNVCVLELITTKNIYDVWMASLIDCFPLINSQKTIYYDFFNTNP